MQAAAPNANANATMRSLECESCNKTFSQKSSLVRHMKLCLSNRPASLRQKSCRQCSTAKAKCDLYRPSCSRCDSKGTPCHYPAGAAAQPLSHAVSQTSNTGVVGAKAPAYSSQVTEALKKIVVIPDDPPTDSLLLEHDALDQTSTSRQCSSESTDSSYPTEVSTPDFTGLTDHWLMSMLPSTGTTPSTTKHSMETVLRVLRSWPRMIAKGFQLPPVFHHSVLSQRDLPVLLANCFTICNMWNGQVEGADNIVRDTIIKEMKTIFAHFQTYDDTNLLAALQALTIYTIILILPSRHQDTLPLIDNSIFVNLQHIVYYTANTGLTTQKDHDRSTPNWDSWIQAMSKSRSVLTLYLLHWSYSVYHDLPSFNCDDIGFIPAPAARFLWDANSKEQWESLYRRWIVQWGGHEYMQGELGNIRPGVLLDVRAQMWLEDADEFGLLFMSLVNATDRQLQFAFPSKGFQSYQG